MTGTSKPSPSALDREKRVAEALRENLRKRKEQQQARRPPAEALKSRS